VTEPSGYTVPTYLSGDLLTAAFDAPQHPFPGFTPYQPTRRERLRASWWSWRTRLGERVAGRTFTCDCED
jgi:hypothetical protein